MPQPPLMAWPMRRIFSGVAFGDRGCQRFDPRAEIGNDGGVDLPHSGLGHHLAELGENSALIDGLIGVEEREDRPPAAARRTAFAALRHRRA